MGGLTEDGLEEYFNFEGSGLALFQLSDILDSFGKGPFKNYVILLGEGGTQKYYIGLKVLRRRGKGGGN